MANIDQLCQATAECVATDPVVSIALALFTGIVTALVATTLIHIERAWPRIEDERERTRAERDAFEEFSRRIEALDADTSRRPIPANGTVAPLVEQRASGGLDQVKDVYRDTVMAVPHYEEEYDEPIEANMTAELGAGIAAAVQDETELTPPLQAALVGGSDEARRKRVGLLRRLEHEASDLRDAESRLRDVLSGLEAVENRSSGRRDFAGLFAAWNRLRELESQCRSILTDRQGVLHARGGRSDDVPSIQEYLYQPLEVDYPVLASGTALAGRIDETRREVESTLAGCG